MQTRKLITISLSSLLLLSAAITQAAHDDACHDILHYNATKLSSTQQIDFCEQFAGKALLVVNTASQCGFTTQFQGLEALHQKYGDRLAVIGFPSDDFNQEYEESEQIANVCYKNYGVTFVMLEPSQVRGENANIVFKKLIEQTGEEPSWNFNKYLVSDDGQTIKHFSSSSSPTGQLLIEEIDKLLAAD